jgi:hypothetical protein
VSSIVSSGAPGVAVEPTSICLEVTMPLMGEVTRA